MKVLLISANTEQINMPAIPLGLACVVEAVKNAGHDVTMLDLMFEIDINATLKRIITEFRPECIGISVRNIDDQNMEAPKFLLDKVKEVVTVCRDLSDSPIVLGGAGYSMFPESALAYLDADFGIAGEGETAFPALLMRLENNDDLSGIPGLYSRNHGPYPPKTFCRDLDKLKLPETRILSNFASQNHDPWIPVQTRRGCAIERMGFLLLGGPGETRQSVEESLAFADSLKLDALRLTVGIRIYPETQLAETAKKQGVITSESNLLFPHFYLSQGLEGWLPELLKKWQASRPFVIM